MLLMESYTSWPSFLRVCARPFCPLFPALPHVTTLRVVFLLQPPTSECIRQLCSNGDARRCTDWKLASCRRRFGWRRLHGSVSECLGGFDNGLRMLVCKGCKGFPKSLQAPQPLCGITTCSGPGGFDHPRGSLEAISVALLREE